MGYSSTSQSFNHKEALNGVKYVFALNWRQYHSSIISVLVLRFLSVLLWRYSERFSTLRKKKKLIWDASLLFPVPFFISEKCLLVYLAQALLFCKDARIILRKLCQMLCKSKGAYILFYFLDFNWCIRSQNIHINIWCAWSTYTALNFITCSSKNFKTNVRMCSLMTIMRKKRSLFTHNKLMQTFYAGKKSNLNSLFELKYV